jgi:hypothetical protein
MLRDLVIKNRSYRRFLQEKVEMKTLKELVDLARMSPPGPTSSRSNTFFPVKRRRTRSSPRS